jgi:hypothetical protein
MCGNRILPEVKMDKSEAVKLLKEQWSRLTHLETLKPFDKEQNDWSIGLLEIIESGFGRHSKEYSLINSLPPLTDYKNEKKDREECLRDLSRQEAIIKQIVKDNSVMHSIWITYDWDDNKDLDVDFCAQELSRAGLEVKLDRWNLGAGKRLWEQIETFIQDPTLSDGWVFYATQMSLCNGKCKEELSYALDRALSKRGNDFPIIALFPSTLDEQLIPASIKTRLYVSIVDQDWKERIISAVEKRIPNISKPRIEPYAIKIQKSGEQFIIEMRPRAGTWSPFIVCIPKKEKDTVSPHLHYGAANRPPTGIVLTSLSGYMEGTLNDGNLWFTTTANEATPTQSYYLMCKKLPSLLVFGVYGGSQYQVTFS